MATEKIEFTKLKLDNLRPAPPGQRYELADTHVSGLRVRVGDATVEAGKFRGKAAQISFVLLARFPTKPNALPTRRTLGHFSREFPSLTLDEARAKAAHWKAMVKAGIDPALEAKREKADRERALAQNAEEHRRRKTVRAALDAYEAGRLCQLKRGPATRRALDGPKGILSGFLDNDIRLIGRTELAEAIRDRAQSAPVSANRQLAYASAFFRWCVAEEFIDDNPAKTIRRPAKEVPRDRYHSLQEIAEIWEAAGTLGYPFGPLIRLLVALPMRRDEVAGMLVSELALGDETDVRAGVWTLPAARTKRKNALRVPLSPLAASLICSALNDPARPVNSEFVFTTTAVSPVSGFAKAKRRLDTAIDAHRVEGELHTDTGDMPHWTLHDLRTTFNTHACEILNVDIAVADRILNHQATATTSKIQRTYNKSELFDQRRAALNAWDNLLRVQALKLETRNVVAMASIAS